MYNALYAVECGAYLRLCDGEALVDQSIPDKERGQYTPPSLGVRLECARKATRDADKSCQPGAQCCERGDQQEVGDAVGLAAEALAEGEAMAMCLEVAKALLDGHAVTVDGDDPFFNVTPRWEIADKQPGFTLAPSVFEAGSIAPALPTRGETVAPFRVFTIDIGTGVER